MNTKLTAVATVVLAAGFAQAGSDLSLARSYELANTSSEYSSLLTESNLSDIKVSAEAQARYAFNSRDDDTLGDDDTTIGFSMRRTKIGISGKVTDNMKGKIKFAFDRGGTDAGIAKLEDAWLDWMINDDVTLRVGQFKQAFLREETMSATKQLATERSSVNATFTQDFSQGVEARFGGDSWRGNIGFSDGFDTANTAFNSASESDYAFNARFEFLFGEASWDQFKQFTSWRGANAGGLLGAAVAWQTMGDTNPSGTDVDTLSATVDFSWVADGWNFYAAGIYRNIDGGTGMDFDDYGALAQAGVFLTDQDELFGRWEGIFADEDRAVTDNEDLNILTFGWNHYFVPESHAAKFTLELLYTLDEVDPSLVSPSDGRNLLADTEDGQFGLTAQMQFMF